MTTAWQNLLGELLAGDCLNEAPLAPLTTWKVGGKAQCLVRPCHEADLLLLSRVIRDFKLPWWILGGGSNVLISDRGLPGVVIHLSKINQLELLSDGRLRVGAGCSLGELIRFAVEHGLGGLEALAGIPGSVGGAVAGNAGASGQEMSDCLTEIRVWTPLDEAPLTHLTPASCEFAYRYSGLIPQHVVVGATLRLQPHAQALLRQRMAEVVAHRRQAHAVGGPNAGSVFKNPPGQQAWRLIDACGLRGKQLGGAQVSTVHTNFLINRGGASADEMYRLIDEVQQAVRQYSGIELQPEVRFLGMFGDMDEV